MRDTTLAAKRICDDIERIWGEEVWTAGPRWKPVRQSLIDAVVRTLIPSACREHVVGDLWERYTSPGSFVIDAIRTVPFIIASQIRRTSTIGLVSIEAFLFCIGFAVGAGGLIRVIVPVVAALLGLVLRDAYKTGFSLSALQVLRDVTVRAGAVLASQGLVALLWPGVPSPLPAVATGAGASGMVFLLRLQNPGLGKQPRHAFAQVPASLDALVTEVRLYERFSRRAVLIEVCAGVVIAGFFLFPLFAAENWALRAGWGLASAYGLVRRRYRRSASASTDARWAWLQRLAGVLSRRTGCQHAMVSTMWRWYVMPFAPAVVFIMVGGTMVAAGRGRPMWPAAVFTLIAAGIGFIIHRGSQDMARKLRVRIDALKAVEEPGL